MADDPLAQFNALQILALTCLGESESLGTRGMTGTALTIMNRANANLHWLGGITVRGVCLRPAQYQVWDPGANRDRVINIGQNDPSYPAYVEAMEIAKNAMMLDIPDWTNGGVSYFDSKACAPPYWSKGKNPCLVDGDRYYFDLEAIR
jgi:hypothetical protein